MTTPVRAALGGALSLLFPTWCAGCDEPDVPLCDACAATLRPEPRSRTLSDGTPVASALAFDGVAARVLRAFKEDGRTHLAPVLGAALAAVVRTDALAVPVPTSRAAMRRRGYRAAELIARRADLDVARLLLPARAAADQRGLAHRERALNVAGTMRTRHVEGLRVVVVDDVVTTGSTLAEAVRVLRDAGAIVLGAATVAATARRRIYPVDRT